MTVGGKMIRWIGFVACAAMLVLCVAVCGINAAPAYAAEEGYGSVLFCGVDAKNTVRDGDYISDIAVRGNAAKRTAGDNTDNLRFHIAARSGEEYGHRNDPSVNMGLAHENVALGFWMYVSDIGKVKDENGFKLELIYGGTTQNDLYYRLQTNEGNTGLKGALKTGWNWIYIDFSTSTLNDTVTLKIDDNRPYKNEDNKYPVSSIIFNFDRDGDGVTVENGLTVAIDEIRFFDNRETACKKSAVRLETLLGRESDFTTESYAAASANETYAAALTILQDTESTQADYDRAADSLTSDVLNVLHYKNDGFVYNAIEDSESIDATLDDGLSGKAASYTYSSESNGFIVVRPYEREISQITRDNGYLSFWIEFSDLNKVPNDGEFKVIALSDNDDRFYVRWQANASAFKSLLQEGWNHFAIEYGDSAKAYLNGTQFDYKVDDGRFDAADTVQSIRIGFEGGNLSGISGLKMKVDDIRFLHKYTDPSRSSTVNAHSSLALDVAIAKAETLLRANTTSAGAEAYTAAIDAAKAAVAAATQQSDYDTSLTSLATATATFETKIAEEKEAADRAAIADVIEKISAIDGTVTLDSRAGIETARAAYDALDASLQSEVTNAATLTTAETAYNDLKAAEDQKVTALIAAIDAIGTVTLESETAIVSARSVYEALHVDWKVKVNNVDTLTAAENALQALKEAGTGDDNQGGDDDQGNDDNQSSVVEPKDDGCGSSASANVAGIGIVLFAASALLLIKKRKQNA